jgi:hypothetical protein
MIELFNEQKNTLKWAGFAFLGIFILLSLATFTFLKALTFQQVCYGGLPLMSLLALAILFIYELEKQSAPFIQSKYRALPVSTAQLYGANMLVSVLIFVGATIILSIVSYIGFLQNTSLNHAIGEQSRFLFYFIKFPPLIGQLSLLMFLLFLGLQLICLLSIWLVSYLPKSWRFVSQIILFVLLFEFLGVIAGYIQGYTGFSGFNFLNVHFNPNSDSAPFTIPTDGLTFLPLKFFICILAYSVISIVLSILILDKFVETDEKIVLFGKAK